MKFFTILSVSLAVVHATSYDEPTSNQTDPAIKEEPVVAVVKAELYDKRTFNQIDSKTDDPPTKKDDPSTKKDDPSTKKDDPSTKKDDPSTKKDDPSTKKDDPSTKKDDPSKKKKKCPPNPGPSNLLRDAEILKAFAKTVTHDPKGIMKTYVGDDPCKFKGVFCDLRPDCVKAVAALTFNGFYLGKNLKLTGLIEKLTDITVFHANSNLFLPDVPDTSAMKYFFELDLSHNNMTGEFPKSILKGSTMTFLDLRFNEFTGKIPSDLFKMDLNAIFLHANKFDGEIPEEIGQSPATYMYLGDNKISGSLPESIGKMKNLGELHVANLGLKGPIPESLCKGKWVWKLNMTGNHFDEPIPAACMALKKKKKLLL
ncbi:hypothetical protein FKW77_005291 [Venturia effusa]|uniref:Leucine-rich repeat-containing N-terminal plant-type domain-containing protein n=1 Tax=Venturia effusa TaxID=50376 RepID=A0A517LP16_9PEZI|nr:hypothetical protein FKW77_005291 [Venturia effusa]